MELFACKSVSLTKLISFLVTDTFSATWDNSEFKVKTFVKQQT